jgi:hypothetical protein
MHQFARSTANRRKVSDDQTDLHGAVTCKVGLAGSRMGFRSRSGRHSRAAALPSAMAVSDRVDGSMRARDGRWKAEGIEKGRESLNGQRSRDETRWFWEMRSIPFNWI